MVKKISVKKNQGGYEWRLLSRIANMVNKLENFLYIWKWRGVRNFEKSSFQFCGGMVEYVSKLVKAVELSYPGFVNQRISHLPALDVWFTVCMSFPLDHLRGSNEGSRGWNGSKLWKAVGLLRNHSPWTYRGYATYKIWNPQDASMISH